MATKSIDGSVLEGGGQILRNSISFATLLGRPVSIENVRNSRRPPGLKNQHATGIKLAADICSAKLAGIEVGSTLVSFSPARISPPAEFHADSVTAGATTLLLQIAFPILLFAPNAGDGKNQSSMLTLLGGTNATNAPQIDYIQHVFLPFMQKHFALEGIKIDVQTRGYYPRGGGKLVCSIPAVHRALPNFKLLERGEVANINGIAHVGGLPLHLAKSMVESATSVLVRNGIKPELINIQATREKNDNTVGAGSGIVLWAETSTGCVLGGSSVGSKKKQAAGVGAEAAEELIHALQAGGCVDEWMQDQVILFMALARGQSSLNLGKADLTLHTKTAIWVAEQMSDAKFDIVREPSGYWVVHCIGIGYQPARAGNGDRENQ